MTTSAFSCSANSRAACGTAVTPDGPPATWVVVLQVPLSAGAGEPYADIGIRLTMPISGLC